MTWHVEFSDIIFLWLNIQVTSGPIEESGEKTTVIMRSGSIPFNRSQGKMEGQSPYIECCLFGYDFQLKPTFWVKNPKMSAEFETLYYFNGNYYLWESAHYFAETYTGTLCWNFGDNKPDIYISI